MSGGKGDGFKLGWSRFGKILYCGQLFRSHVERSFARLVRSRCEQGWASEAGRSGRGTRPQCLFPSRAQCILCDWEG